MSEEPNSDWQLVSGRYGYELVVVPSNPAQSRVVATSPSIPGILAARRLLAGERGVG